MTSGHELILCTHCDAAYRRIALRPGERAHCRRCGSRMASGAHPDADRYLAVALTAAVLYAIAAVSPILSIEFGGVHTSASLWAAAVSLGHGWITGAAIVLGLTVCCIPLLQIVVLLWVLTFARLGRLAPAGGRALTLLQALRPWSMTEVFLLAVLVAIVKLSGWVHVSLDSGAWALAGLAGTLALLNSQSPHAWWRLLEEPPR